MSEDLHPQPAPRQEPESDVRLEFTDPDGQRIWALYSKNQADAPPEPALSFDLQELPYILMRQKRVVIACVVVTVALGVLYLLLATPIFGASAEIMVERRASPLQEFARMTGGNIFLATQAEVIHSPSIVEPALATLPFRLTDDPEKDPLRIALKSFSVTPIHDTDVLAIHYRGVDGQQGVALISAVLDQYRAFLDEVESEGHGEGLGLLRKREEDLRRELAELEERYQASLRESGDISDPEGINFVERGVLEGHASRASDAANRRQTLEGELADLKRAMARGDWSITSENADPRLREELSLTSSELARLRISHSESHPAVRQMAARVAEVQRQIVQQMETALRSARRTEARLQATYQQERERSGAVALERRTQERLASEIERLSQIHTAAATMLAEKQLTVDALDQSGVIVRVLEPPKQEEDQLWPQPALVLLPCIAIGGLGGIALALIRDRARPSATMSRVPKARPSDLGAAPGAGASSPVPAQLAEKG